jgi:hypothetical protein
MYLFLNFGYKIANVIILLNKFSKGAYTKIKEGRK